MENYKLVVTQSGFGFRDRCVSGHGIENGLEESETRAWQPSPETVAVIHSRVRKPSKSNDHEE